MATYVHLTDEKNIPAIKRSGLKPQKIHIPEIGRGVFCMPVTDDYFATHQWARELKRFGMKSPWGIYFQVKDEEPAWFEHYILKHRLGTASEAMADFRSRENKMGFQVIIPRKIQLNEIKRYRQVPLLGWRFYPAAKGKQPCLCPACIGRGEYGSRQMGLQSIDTNFAKYRETQDVKIKIKALYAINQLVADRLLPFDDWERLLFESLLSEEKLMKATMDLFGVMKNKAALEALVPYVEKSPDSIKRQFASAVLYSGITDNQKLLAPFCHLPEVIEEIREYEEWME